MYSEKNKHPFSGRLIGLIILASYLATIFHPLIEAQENQTQAVHAHAELTPVVKVHICYTQNAYMHQCSACTLSHNQLLSATPIQDFSYRDLYSRVIFRNDSFPKPHRILTCVQLRAPPVTFS